MEAILIIVVAVAAIYGVQWLIGTTIQTADRTIRHKTLQDGRREAATGLEIKAPVPSADLLPRIVKTVNAHESSPALVVGLYLKSQDASQAAFAFGSKTHGDAFVATVDLADYGGGCRGEFEVLGWTESGADVQGKKEMTRLRTRIETAVRDVGGVAATTS